MAHLLSNHRDQTTWSVNDWSDWLQATEVGTILVHERRQAVFRKDSADFWIRLIDGSVFSSRWLAVTLQQHAIAVRVDPVEEPKNWVMM